MSIEQFLHPPGIEECAKCRDCGRTVHDFIIPDEIWNDVIGSPWGVWCYDCFCERASKKGYIAVFKCELAHPKTRPVRGDEMNKLDVLKHIGKIPEDKTLGELFRLVTKPEQKGEVPVREAESGGDARIVSSPCDSRGR